MTKEEKYYQGLITIRENLLKKHDCWQNDNIVEVLAKIDLLLEGDE